MRLLDGLERFSLVPKHLGTFKTGPVVVLTDPCYEPGTWCMIEDVRVEEGVWDAWVVSGENVWREPFNDTRCLRLLVTLKGSACSDVEVLELSELEGTVGVDSGQAGVYDEKAYDPKNEEWYDKNIALTITSVVNPDYERECQEYVRRHSEYIDAWRRYKEEGGRDPGEPPERPSRYHRRLSAGVLQGGCVSSSGLGDGGYSAYGLLGEHGFKALMLDFYGSPEENEE